MWVHPNIMDSSTCAFLHPGSFLDSSSAMLTVAACTALGEIGRNGTLLIPAEGEGFTKLSTVENLLARIPSGKESTKVNPATSQIEVAAVMFCSVMTSCYTTFLLYVLMKYQAIS